MMDWTSGFLLHKGRGLRFRSIITTDFSIERCPFQARFRAGQLKVGAINPVIIGITKSPRGLIFHTGRVLHLVNLCAGPLNSVE